MKSDIPNIHMPLWNLDGFEYVWAKKLAKIDVYNVKDLFTASDSELANVHMLNKKHIPAMRQAQNNFIETIPTGSQLSEDFKQIANLVDFYNRLNFPISRCFVDGYHCHSFYAYKNWQTLYRMYTAALFQED